MRTAPEPRRGRVSTVKPYSSMMPRRWCLQRFAIRLNAGSGIRIPHLSRPPFRRFPPRKRAHGSYGAGQRARLTGSLAGFRSLRYWRCRRSAMCAIPGPLRASNWRHGADSNHRPVGYEPTELPLLHRDIGAVELHDSIPASSPALPTQDAPHVGHEVDNRRRISRRWSGQCRRHEKPAHMRIVERRGGCVIRKAVIARDPAHTISRFCF